MSTKLLTIEGNLGANPIVKVIASGKTVCNFSVAMDEEWIDANNTKQKRVEWHNVECWDKFALDCEKNLMKGSKVAVTGTQKISCWKDKEGKERFSKLIKAQKIDFLSSSATNDNNPSVSH